MASPGDIMLRRCVMGVLALVLGSPLLCGGTAASPGLVTSWHYISRPGAKVHASGLTGTPGGEETRACSSLAASGACSRAFRATAAGRGHSITDSISRTTGSCHPAVARSSALVPANLAHAMIRDARFQGSRPRAISLLLHLDFLPRMWPCHALGHATPPSRSEMTGPRHRGVILAAIVGQALTGPQTAREWERAKSKHGATT